MERDFKRPKVGDVYEISKRFDRGGWPCIRVLKVARVSMTVQDCFRDGSTPDHYEQGPRIFRDPQWQRLRKCWKRQVRRVDRTTNRAG